MSWIAPTVADIPAGGQFRSEGEFNRRAYDRAYYHAKRKGKERKPLTAEQKERRRIQARERYAANPEHMRALARANYWRHRDEYALKSTERSRQRAKR